MLKAFYGLSLFHLYLSFSAPPIFVFASKDRPVTTAWLFSFSFAWVEVLLARLRFFFWVTFLSDNSPVLLVFYLYLSSFLSGLFHANLMYCVSAPRSFSFLPPGYWKALNTATSAMFSSLGRRTSVHLFSYILSIRKGYILFFFSFIRNESRYGGVRS